MESRVNRRNTSSIYFPNATPCIFLSYKLILVCDSSSSCILTFLFAIKTWSTMNVVFCWGCHVSVRCDIWKIPFSLQAVVIVEILLVCPPFLQANSEPAPQTIGQPVWPIISILCWPPFMYGVDLYMVQAYTAFLGLDPLPSSGEWLSLWYWGELAVNILTIALTVLEDICDKPIRIQSYCAVARLHGVWQKETEDLLREIQW
jgi:hypothetical protein